MDEYKITVVIPNYNGMKYLKDCMDSLRTQTMPARILIVDNGSTDESVPYLRENYPEAELICLSENTGFCKAVNIGIKASDTPYVILLNNDTKVKSEFNKCLYEAIEKDERLFAVSSCMLDWEKEGILDNAGDLYCSLGWAFAIGKGRRKEDHNLPKQVFSACAGAAIYRRSVFEQIGYFDERHFAYLEDVDMGWRANIAGYRNAYEPSAEVYHAGSAFSGSRYNAFKVDLSSANNVYIVWKNMPFLQWLINLPLLLFGTLVKQIFFIRKGLGGTYFKGTFKGIRKSLSKEGFRAKVWFRPRNFGNYCRIQWQMWINCIRRLKA